LTLILTLAGFEIAMDHVFLVRGVKRFRDLPRVVQPV
jgi:hypothetical protein